MTRSATVLYVPREFHTPTRPIQNRLLRNFRNTRVTGGGAEPAFLSIDLLEIKRAFVCQERRPGAGRAAWSVFPAARSDCHNHRSGDEGSSAARIDFCSVCIAVLGDCVAARLLPPRLIHRLLPGYDSAPSSLHLTVWHSVMCESRGWCVICTRSMPPHWLWGYLFWGWFGGHVAAFMHYAENIAVLAAGEKQ